VTVIVPLHNGALCIRRCLEAIAAQTYRPLEIVVVDDGSTDPSAAWVRSFRMNHPQVSVHVHPQPRFGTAAALNEGLARARGEFVAFAHQADEWLPAKLAVQVAQLQARPQAACSAAALVEQVGKQKLRIEPPRAVGLPLRPIPLSSLVMRRASIERLGGFDEDQKGVCGFELLTRLMLRETVLRLGLAVAICHRKAASPLPVSQMAAVWDKLYHAGLLDERQLAWMQGTLLARRGWQALLADEPERARDFFRNAVAATPWRPEIWVGLGCARLDQLLFALGLLRRDAETSLAHAER
jgi:glycosyltransferase involved in cell wall biosynthesis